MMAFKVDNGQLQRKDINPSAGGFSTEDLTNPTVDDYLDNKQQVVLGTQTKQLSPLVFIFAAVVFLIGVSFLQDTVK